MNRDAIPIERARVRPNDFARLHARIQDHTISGNIAKDVLDAMWAGEGDPDAIIDQKGLKQISDVGTIEKIVVEVLEANAAIVADYKAGKDKAFQSLVGKTMAASRGKANPSQVNAALKKMLGSTSLVRQRPACRAAGQTYVFVGPASAAVWIYRTMKDKGITKIAIVSSNDGFGPAGKKQLEDLAKTEGIEIPGGRGVRQSRRPT